jgi:hypothetical protein
VSVDAGAAEAGEMRVIKGGCTVDTRKMAGDANPGKKTAGAEWGKQKLTRVTLAEGNHAMNGGSNDVASSSSSGIFIPHKQNATNITERTL